MLVIDIIEQHAKIQLLNIYNESDQGGTSQNTLKQCLYAYPLEPTSVVLGDFNTHHPWWDPLANKSQNADELVNWLEIANLTLVNTPGTGTFFRPNLPRESVLDLGVWFDSGLMFKQHVAIRISQARSAFQRMTRLANTKKGLSPFALRQLYMACITSIADYGSVIWWKGQA